MGNETRKLSEQINVRLSADEKQLLKEQAAQRGVRPGTHARLILIRSLKRKRS